MSDSEAVVESAEEGCGESDIFVVFLFEACNFDKKGLRYVQVFFFGKSVGFSFCVSEREGARLHRALAQARQGRHEVSLRDSRDPSLFAPMFLGLSTIFLVQHSIA